MHWSRPCSETVTCNLLFQVNVKAAHLGEHRTWHKRFGNTPYSIIEFPKFLISFLAHLLEALGSTYILCQTLVFVHPMSSWSAITTRNFEDINFNFCANTNLSHYFII